MAKNEAAFPAVVFGNAVVELSSAFCTTENCLVFHPDCSTETHRLDSFITSQLFKVLLEDNS